MKKASLLIVGLAFLAAACSARQIVKDSVDIARSGGDLRKAAERKLEQKVQQKEAEYESDPLKIIDDTKAAKQQFDKVMAFLARAVGKEWGTKDAKVPTKSEMVKYTDNYRSRAIIDFDHGLVTVETVHEQKREERLRGAVVAALLTPDDPRAVDLFSDKPVEPSGTPFLYGLVLDGKKPIKTKEEAEAFADALLKAGVKERAIERDGGRKTVGYFSFPMVNDYEDKKANKYSSFAAAYAERHKVSKSLVMAVIRTESNFNPWAVSPAPAYGLMQLVPTSGGREAYHLVTGKDEAPTTDYLFDAEHNIELGSAYLGALNSRHLAKVGNEVSREYCVISAYNTGPGNVLRTFAKKRDEAMNRINSLPPHSVYEKLVNELPYEETRHYLVKVTGYRKQYSGK